MAQAAALNRAERSVLWLVINLLLAAVIAWIAFQLQQEQIAPAVIFPLAVGAALGAGNMAITRIVRLPPRRTAIWAAVVWGLLVVVGQDYIAHRRRLQMYESELERQPLAAMMTADERQLRPGFWQYLATVVRTEPLWWSIELVLTCGAAALVTAAGLRQPSSGETSKA